MDGRLLDFIALGMLVFVSLTFIYGIIYIHDIPYEIAKKRNHPHQDAIHTAGWVSLFLMHTIWPFLWIWATLYKPGHGWGMQSKDKQEDAAALSPRELQSHIARMEKSWAAQQKTYNAHINALHKRVKQLEGQLKEGEK